MGITKSLSTASVLISGIVNYTITVSNADGAGTATGITMVDSLPQALEFAGTTGESGAATVA